MACLLWYVKIHQARCSSGWGAVSVKLLHWWLWHMALCADGDTSTRRWYVHSLLWMCERWCGNQTQLVCCTSPKHTGTKWRSMHGMCEGGSGLDVVWCFYCVSDMCSPQCRERNTLPRHTMGPWAPMKRGSRSINLSAWCKLKFEMVWLQSLFALVTEFVDLFWIAMKTWQRAFYIYLIFIHSSPHECFVCTADHIYLVCIDIIHYHRKWIYWIYCMMSKINNVYLVFIPAAIS